MNRYRKKRYYFKDIARDWLESLKPQLKESSISKYRNILSNYIIPTYGEREIGSITYNEVYSYSLNLLNVGGMRGKGLSPKSINGILSVMRSIIKFAFEKYGIDSPDIKDIYIKQSTRPLKVLSIEEQRKINQYLFNDLSPCNIGILLCLYTGIRIGEVCALRWQDINISEQYLFVHMTMQRIQVDDHNGQAKKTRIILLLLKDKKRGLL